MKEIFIAKSKPITKNDPQIYANQKDASFASEQDEQGGTTLIQPSSRQSAANGRFSCMENSAYYYEGKK
ncbi:MAG TPA: hypothetical protein VMV97_02435 [Sulfuriferula sp.]|nr:hypothetical protein [Sulfuriferula sp.]